MSYDYKTTEIKKVIESLIIKINNNLLIDNENISEDLLKVLSFVQLVLRDERVRKIERRDIKKLKEILFYQLVKNMNDEEILNKFWDYESFNKSKEEFIYSCRFEKLDKHEIFILTDLLIKGS